MVEITLADTTRVVVPDTLNELSPYVFAEQRDWFEDETDFVRRYLRPGMNALDIGAGYGAYTLLAAQRVGKTGHVWAVEPSEKTCVFLQNSIDANSLRNITILRHGMSRTSGEAYFRMYTESTANCIVQDEDSASTARTIPVKSLDDLCRDTAWSRIDFLKIDAEGMELEILGGGRDFFRTHSPLVMFEFIHGGRIDPNLLSAFENLGSGLYRLVPGVGVLVPFRLEDPMDTNFFLNLFACPKGLEGELEARNLLVRDKAHIPPRYGDVAGEWSAYCLRNCYAGMFSVLWKGRGYMIESDYQKVLDHVAYALNEGKPAEQRVASLWHARAGLLELCRKSPSYSRYATLIRVLLHLGLRTEANSIMRRLAVNLPLVTHEKLSEPFTPVLKRYEDISMFHSTVEWYRSSIREAMEYANHFSSYFTGTDTVLDLEALVESGIASDEIARRLVLVKTKASGGRLSDCGLPDVARHGSAVTKY